MGNLRGEFVTDAGFAPVRTLTETQRAHRIVLGHVAVFAIGAASSLQLANFTVTLLSVVCLLLVPGFLLMTHRGADLLPLVLAALGWISFLASCLVNGVSTGLEPTRAVAIGRLTGRPRRRRATRRSIDRRGGR